MQRTMVDHQMADIFASHFKSSVAQHFAPKGTSSGRRRSIASISAALRDRSLAADKTFQTAAWESNLLSPATVKRMLATTPKGAVPLQQPQLMAESLPSLGEGQQEICQWCGNPGHSESGCRTREYDRQLRLRKSASKRITFQSSSSPGRPYRSDERKGKRARGGSSQSSNWNKHGPDRRDGSRPRHKPPAGARATQKSSADEKLEALTKLVIQLARKVGAGDQIESSALLAESEPVNPTIGSSPSHPWSL
jgi:hypothetical protein